ncbi:MAG: alpha/beta fold hydrolase [Kineosporiaceae bacterium]
MAVPVMTLAGAGLAVGTPAQAATTPAAAPSASEAALDTPGVPAALARQRLDWQECIPGAGFPQFECAGVEVPKDWSKPAGEHLTIAVSRVKASDAAARRGVLLSNPGGPGGSGLILSLYFSLVEPDLAAAYDLIGIDPRGVGSSSPALACADPAILNALYGLDGRDTSATNQKRFLDLNTQYAATCSADPLTRHIRTDQVVRDYDLVRSVLRESKVSYVGYSAGTWLGSWYAAVFPKRVDRFVLDGNLDFTSRSQESFDRQPPAFQNSFESYLLPWIASYDEVYQLGTTKAAVKKVYEARRAVLAKTPLTLADGSTLNAAGYDSGIAGSLYWTGLYDGLATALSTLEHYATATDEQKAQVLDVFGSGGAEGNDVFWAVVCQDDKSSSYDQVLDVTRRFRRTAPLIGASWNANPCPFWPGRPKGSPVEGDELPKLLMINNDADPATPLGNALSARRNTPNARLVTVTDQPDHTIYGNGDACVEGIANGWLINGVLPRRDTRCAGLPLPVPEALGTAGAAAARAASPAARAAAVPRMPAKVWIEQFQKTHGTPKVS